MNAALPIVGAVSLIIVGGIVTGVFGLQTPSTAAGQIDLPDVSVNQTEQGDDVETVFTVENTEFVDLSLDLLEYEARWESQTESGVLIRGNASDVEIGTGQTETISLTTETVGNTSGISDAQDLSLVGEATIDVTIGGVPIRETIEIERTQLSPTADTVEVSGFDDSQPIRVDVQNPSPFPVEISGNWTVTWSETQNGTQNLLATYNDTISLDDETTVEIPYNRTTELDTAIQTNDRLWVRVTGDTTIEIADVQIERDLEVTDDVSV